MNCFNETTLFSLKHNSTSFTVWGLLRLLTILGKEGAEKRLWENQAGKEEAEGLGET